MSRRSLILFLVSMLLPGLALAHTVAVTQGETVTLNLKAVNTGAEAITGLEASCDSNPRWLTPADSSLTVDVPGGNKRGGKPCMWLPLTFKVDRNAPPEGLYPITVKLVDGKDNFWTKNIHLEVLPGKFLLRQNYPKPGSPIRRQKIPRLR